MRSRPEVVVEDVSDVVAIDAPVVDAMGERDEIPGETGRRRRGCACHAEDSSSCSLIPSHSGRPYLAATVVLPVRADGEERLVQRLGCFEQVDPAQLLVFLELEAGKSFVPGSRVGHERRDAFVMAPVGRRMRVACADGPRRAREAARDLVGEPAAGKASWLQRACTRRNGQWSMRLAVAPSGSSFSRAISRSRTVAPRYSLWTTQITWPVFTACPASTESSVTRPARCAVISFSIFILATTQEHLAGLDVVAVGDFDGEHGAPHRADHGVPRRAVVSSGGNALAPSPGKLGVQRRGGGA